MKVKTIFNNYYIALINHCEFEIKFELLKIVISDAGEIKRYFHKNYDT